MSLLPCTYEHAAYADCDAPHCRVIGATLEDTVTGARYCSETCAARDIIPATPAYTAIARAAVALGWPVAFRRDLTLHDRRALARVAVDGRFLWAIYEKGTHLLIDGGEAPRGSMPTTPALVRSIVESFGPVRWYAWDGGLEAVSTERSIELCRRWDGEHRARRMAS